MRKTLSVFFINRRVWGKRHCLLAKTVPAVKKDYTFWMFIQSVCMNIHQVPNHQCDLRCDFRCDFRCNLRCDLRCNLRCDLRCDLPRKIWL